MNKRVDLNESNKQDRETVDIEEQAYRFSIDELELELAARGAHLPGEKWFKFRERNETYRGGISTEQPGKVHIMTKPPAANKKLSRFSTSNLVKMLIFKAGEFQTDNTRGVWGLDDRKDIYDIDNDQIRENADCVAAICLKQNMTQESPGFYSLPTKKFGPLFSLDQEERFWDQPVFNGWICTGFLVKEDVIATACHCADNCKLPEIRFLFGYRMLNRCKAVTEIPEKDIYRAVKIIDKNSITDRKLPGNIDIQPDWALLQLDRKVENRRIARLS
ncbi:MAG: trypsin-like serine protease, partial [Candidatus Aminicenantes bacterium]|nr:trypsin-like serine protease [Candidatus Aminicenantes bacterium]